MSYLTARSNFIISPFSYYFIVKYCKHKSKRKQSSERYLCTYYLAESFLWGKGRNTYYR